LRDGNAREKNAKEATASPVSDTTEPARDLVRKVATRQANIASQIGIVFRETARCTKCDNGLRGSAADSVQREHQPDDRAASEIEGGGVAVVEGRGQFGAVGVLFEAEHGGGVDQERHDAEERIGQPAPGKGEHDGPRRPVLRTEHDAAAKREHREQRRSHR
jgi:hypothetical protein